MTSFGTLWMVQGLVDMILTESMKYPAFGLVCAFAGLLMPIPEDVVIVYGGQRVATGQWSFWPTLIAAFLGVGIRDCISWLLGRALFRWGLDNPYLSFLRLEERVMGAKDMVERHGWRSVFFGRWFVGFRAGIFAACGFFGIPFRTFLLWDTIGLILVIPLTLALGWYFGEPVREFFTQFISISRWLGVLLVAWGIWWLLRPNSQKGHRRSQNP